MSKGEYAAFYGPIGYQLAHIAAGQRDYSYAIIPEAVYDDWKKLVDFDDEKVETVIGEEKASREQFVAHFTDTEHSWSVTTVKCPHPAKLQDTNWRLIVEIKRDDEVISRSKMSVDDFWRYIKSLS